MNGALQTARSGGLDTVDRLDLAGLTLDLGREELRDATGARIELRNRSFAVLRHLATNAGRVVTKDELLQVNWPGVTVTEDSLTQCISDIRRALGDAGRDLVRTVPRRGYLFVLPVPSSSEAATLVAAARPEIAWHRRLHVVIPVLLGVAVLGLWGSWIFLGNSRPEEARAPLVISRGPTVA